MNHLRHASTLLVAGALVLGACTTDHAGDQPFIRTLEGFEIPEGVDEIIVQGRDLEHGWGGDTVTVTVPRT